MWITLSKSNAAQGLECTSTHQNYGSSSISAQIRLHSTHYGVVGEGEIAYTTSCAIACNVVIQIEVLGLLGDFSIS